MKSILKIILINAITIGLNCLMSSAPGTLGIRVGTPKFSLAKSTLPIANPFVIYLMYGLTRGYNHLKNTIGRPSGPGAVSTFIIFRTRSISSHVKVIMIPWFSSSETCPCASQRERDSEKSQSSPSSPRMLT